MFFWLHWEHMDHSLPCYSRSHSSSPVSQIYSDVGTTPFSPIFLLLSSFSLGNNVPPPVGFNCHLSVDDTPTFTSNQNFSSYFSLLHFHCCLDICWNLKPACLQLSHFLLALTGFFDHHLYFSYSLRPRALMPVLIYLVTKSCLSDLRHVGNPFPPFGPYCRKIKLLVNWFFYFCISSIQNILQTTAVSIFLESSTDTSLPC